MTQPESMGETIPELLKRAVAAVDAMTPEQREAMFAEQRKSLARGMAPCEHGIADWEECEDCRAAAIRKPTP